MSAQGMPPNLLAFFVPRPHLEYLPPLNILGIKHTYTGMAPFVKYFSSDPPPPVEVFETPKEKQRRRKKEKIEKHLRKQRELIELYDPHSIQNATSNAYATLFVARISYETVEKKLKKEFEVYGKIRKCKIITDFNGKSRGYAFIEYENESDLKKAYKQGDGKKIDGRRVLVDVERSRTVPNWIPRRLGGGKGPSRFTEPKKKNSRGASSSNLPTTSFSNSTVSSYTNRSSYSSWQRSNQSSVLNSKASNMSTSGRYDDPSNVYSRRLNHDNNRKDSWDNSSYHYSKQNYVEATRNPHSFKDDHNKEILGGSTRNNNHFDKQARRRNRSKDHISTRYRSRSRESKF